MDQQTGIFKPSFAEKNTRHTKNDYSLCSRPVFDDVVRTVISVTLKQIHRVGYLNFELSFSGVFCCLHSV